MSAKISTRDPWTYVCLLLSCSMLVNGEVNAGENSIYMTTGVGTYDTDRKNDQDTAWIGTIGFEYSLTERFGVELSGLKTLANDKNFDVGAGRLDALHYMTSGIDRWRPYVAGGFGFGKREFGYNTIDSALANVGVGLKYHINSNFALRADLRHIHHFDDDHKDTAFTFGFSVKLSEDRAPLVPVAEDTGSKWDAVETHFAETNVDTSQKEVVKGESEQKSSNSADTSVELNAAVPAVFTPSYKGDEDRDGVPDQHDECLLTPFDVDVDKKGCAVDLDLDTVPDYVDRCPDTALGLTVDKHGCHAPESAASKEASLELNIYYEFGSDQIRKQYLREFEELAAFLKTHSDMVVSVEGHTDSVGSKASNLKLSIERAEGIKKILVDNFGIEAERLIIVGFGETRPIANNSCYLGRRKNRRVELRSVKKTEKPVQLSLSALESNKNWPTPPNECSS